MLHHLSAHMPVQEDDELLNIALIALIGSDRFFDKLADTLGRALPFKWLHIFQYFKDSAPIALANFPPSVAYKRGFENYLNYTYVINPTYRAFQMNAEAGVFPISDFIQKGYDEIIDSADCEIRIEDTEAIGYRTPGWPKNMAEFIILIYLPNGTAIDFTFLTDVDNSHLKLYEARLRKVFRTLDAILIKQFEIDVQSFEPANARPGQEDSFQDFGRDALTDREREVVQLILVGHNSNSIALKLDVSLSTIKTHRRNIYSKLQISSQAELFSLFLLHLR